MNIQKNIVITDILFLSLFMSLFTSSLIVYQRSAHNNFIFSLILIGPLLLLVFSIIYFINILKDVFYLRKIENHKVIEKGHILMLVFFFLVSILALLLILFT